MPLIRALSSAYINFARRKIGLALALFQDCSLSSG
eukprot:gene7900-1111_t